jgi:hypothetical protein
MSMWLVWLLMPGASRFAAEPLPRPGCRRDHTDRDRLAGQTAPVLSGINSADTAERRGDGR